MSRICSGGHYPNDNIGYTFIEIAPTFGFMFEFFPREPRVRNS